jgi:hypothetical protein
MFFEGAAAASLCLLVGLGVKKKYSSAACQEVSRACDEVWVLLKY